VADRLRERPRLPHRLWTVATGVAGFVVFFVIAALVQARLLAGVDLAAAEAKQDLTSGLLDLWSAAVGIAVSGELSVVYAGIGVLLLWRAGVGRWSVAPMAFVALVPLEVILKSAIHQPAVPLAFYRGVYDPLLNVVLQGTFPSGHAIRAGFLCTFLAIVLSARRGIAAWLAPVGLGLLAVLMGLSRVYLGDHWLSDVVAGLILGAALALVVTPLVIERLRTERSG